MKSFSSNHISSCIKSSPNNLGLRFIGFYGEPIVEERWRSWDLLRYLNNQDICSPLICGNFNEIVFPWEKLGGRPKPMSQILHFRQIISELI